MPSAYLDLSPPSETSPPTVGLPVLAKAAFRGIVGDFITLIEPYSEASLAAVLVQFLIGFGNAVGRGPHFTAGADRHYMNEFGVVVGETANARKGMAWNFAREPLRRADPTWFSKSVKGGLASGEGVIAALDAKTDKRLLAYEPEFSRVLKTADRSGNVLSDIMRQAWDGGDLSVMTRQHPLTVTEPHVSLVGHITVDELRALLTDVTTLNGFANRFLWVFAARRRYLPDGDAPSTQALEYFAEDTKNALVFARTVQTMSRSQNADSLWRAVYEQLSSGRAGMFGAATARAEAHVMRLACIYALMDMVAEIGVEHLQAALAVWSYCEESARYVFGDAPADPVAHTILAALRNTPTGLTRAEISGLFSRDRNSAEIQAALDELVAAGQAYATKQAGFKGRPAERWFAKALD